MKRAAVVYAIVVAVSALAILGLLRMGDSLPHAERARPATLAEGTRHGEASGGSAKAAIGLVDKWRQNVGRPGALLIVQLMIILVGARVCGGAAVAVGQPRVVGEIAAGIVLGPSLLGWASPRAFAFLFPDSSLQTLGALSQIGVLLFMFVVGMEIDLANVRARASTALAVSHFGIVVPFVVGVALSLWLYEGYAPPGVPFHSFGLFMGIALSITAFPVLARILEERGLSRTPLGSTALTCAAVEDVTAWTLLALVVAVATTGGATWLLAVTLGEATVLAMALLLVVRPLLRRVLGPATSELTQGRTAIALGVLFASALATDVIGIHALFGAFVAGAIMPDEPRLRQSLRVRVESVSSVFLLPIFFAFTGLHTYVGLLDSPAAWLACVAITLTAIIGKLGGCLLAARWTGLPWRESFVLGSLMNTRGLMELIALNLGYELGILSLEVFAMMVLMALVTTSMTGPLLHLSLRRGSPELAVAPPSCGQGDTA